MLTIDKKAVWYVVAAFVFAAAMIFATPVSADTIVSQTTADADSKNFGVQMRQTLGTGLSGSIQTFTIRYDITESATSSAYIALFGDECSASDYTGCTDLDGFQDDTDTRIIYIGAAGAGSYSWIATSSVSGTLLSSTKYYRFFIETQGPIKIKGSTSNTYTNGLCIDFLAGSCSAISDWYMVIQGAVGSTPETLEGIKTIISPLNQTTTANNTPTFSYTYYTTSAYDRASFFLKDLTTGQNINTAAASSTNSSSGLHTYSQPFGVTTGHLYEWQPVVYDVAQTLAPMYGPKYVFFAVTTSNYQSLPAPVTNPFGTSAIYSTGWTGATSTAIVATTTASSTNYTQTYTFASTTAFGRCFSSLPDNLRNVMTIKAPFSYICDVQTLIDEMINGDGAASGNLNISLNNLATTTLIDKQAISQISAVQQIKKVAGYAIYLSTALLILWAALRIF